MIFCGFIFRSCHVTEIIFTICNALESGLLEFIDIFCSSSCEIKLQIKLLLVILLGPFLDQGTVICTSTEGLELERNNIQVRNG